MREGLKELLMEAGVDMSTYDQDLFNYTRMRKQLDAELAACAETGFPALLSERGSANPILSLLRTYQTGSGPLVGIACGVASEALERFSTNARRSAYKAGECLSRGKLYYL